MLYIQPLCIMIRTPVTDCTVNRILEIKKTFSNINVLYSGTLDNEMETKLNKFSINTEAQDSSNFEPIMSSFSQKSNGQMTKSSTSKQAFLAWFLRSKTKFAWHMEDDVLMNGNWSKLLMYLAPSHYDFVSCTTDHGVSRKWSDGPVAKTCLINNKTCPYPLIKTRWMLAGISRRYALELVSAFAQNRIAGHHEVITGTYCNTLAWCTRRQFPSVCLGYWTTRGAYTGQNTGEDLVSTAERSVKSGGMVETNKLYHPAKCDTPSTVYDRDSLGEDSDESEACNGDPMMHAPPKKCTSGRVRNVAVCITGQMFRIEMRSKLLNLPQLMKGAQLHWFASIYNNISVFSDSKYSNITNDEDSEDLLLKTVPENHLDIISKNTCIPHSQRWKSFSKGIDNLCNLYQQQRAIVSCGRMILQDEHITGIPYDAVIRIRDNTLVQNVKVDLFEHDGFCEQSVHIKQCSGWGGYNDKVAVIPRNSFNRAMFSPLKLLMSLDRGDEANAIHNAEMLLKNAWNVANVPIKKMELPFVDGRFQNKKWCMVSLKKDCAMENSIQPFSECEENLYVPNNSISQSTKIQASEKKYMPSSTPVSQKKAMEKFATSTLHPTAKYHTPYTRGYSRPSIDTHSFSSSKYSRTPTNQHLQTDYHSKFISTIKNHIEYSL